MHQRKEALRDFLERELISPPRVLHVVHVATQPKRTASIRRELSKPAARVNEPSTDEEVELNLGEQEEQAENKSNESNDPLDYSDEDEGLCSADREMMDDDHNIIAFRSVRPGVQGRGDLAELLLRQCAQAEAGIRQVPAAPRGIQRRD